MRSLTIAEILGILTFVLVWTGAVARVLWQWKIGPLMRDVDEMRKGTAEEPNRRVARLSDLNLVGDRVNVLANEATTREAQLMVVEQRQLLADQAASTTQRELGAQGAELRKISDNIAESSAAIIAHIENARRESSASDGSIRERLAAVERGNDIADALERTMDRLVTEIRK